MWDWFKANWLGVVQTVGVIGAAWGLWLTYSQLKSANAQLEQAKQALRANTIFAIQKDGRELIGTLSADTKLFRFIFDMDKGIAADQELRLKATVRLGQLINFYASIYNQYEAGAVDRKFWKTSLTELCLVLETPFGSSMWRDINKNPDRYQSGFLAEGNTCLQKT
jgi:hypothetical protein